MTMPTGYAKSLTLHYYADGFKPSYRTYERNNVDSFLTLLYKVSDFALLCRWFQTIFK